MMWFNFKTIFTTENIKTSYRKLRADDARKDPWTAFIGPSQTLIKNV